MVCSGQTKELPATQSSSLKSWNNTHPVFRHCNVANWQVFATVFRIFEPKRLKFTREANDEFDNGDKLQRNLNASRTQLTLYPKTVKQRGGKPILMRALGLTGG